MLAPPGARLEPVLAALAAEAWEVVTVDPLVPRPEREPPGWQPDAMVFLAVGPQTAEAAMVRALRRRRAATPLVAVVRSARGRAVRRLLDAGADGLVLESDVRQRLLPTIHAVAVGQVVVPGEQRLEVESAALSSREREVLRQVPSGLTNREIGARLFLSESTVKMHLSSAFSKLGVRSRAEASRLLLEGRGAAQLEIRPLIDEPR